MTMLREVGAEATTGRPRIVVVDDEPSIAGLLRTVLELDGFDVFEALNGPIGLATVEAVLPEVVVLDVMMPGMDGVEVCQHIFTDHPGVRVLILTGSADPSLADRCRDAGAAAFLTKPIEPDALSAAVASLLVVPVD